MTALDSAMRQAHRQRDLATLIGLCQRAAKGPAEPFWLTQAWIHALEAGDPRAPALRDRLKELGAE